MHMCLDGLRHVHVCMRSLPAVHVADCSCACMQRYGKAFSVWVGLLMVLNMGIAMTAEYTAVGDLFELVIGANRVPIVVIIGVVSMLYTAYGGLYVSIITDQWQAWPHFPHIAVAPSCRLACRPILTGSLACRGHLRLWLSHILCCTMVFTSGSAMTACMRCLTDRSHAGQSAHEVMAGHSSHATCRLE